MDSTRYTGTTLLGLLLTGLVLATGCSDDSTEAPAPTVHDDLVTVWRATGVTIDGAPVEMADFFEFSEGAAALNLTIDADATYQVEELDSASDPANVLYYEEGIAESSGQTLTLTKVSEDGVDLPAPVVTAQGTWEVDGFTMTFTMQEAGSTVVITFNNWLS